MIDHNDDHWLTSGYKWSVDDSNHTTILPGVITILPGKYAGYTTGANDDWAQLMLTCHSYDDNDGYNDNNGAITTSW